MLMNTPVSALLSEKASTVFSISSSATALEAVHEMNRHRVGCMLVIDDEKLVGIFTERDVLQRVVAEGLLPESTTVSSVMTSDVETLSPNTTIKKAMEAMTERRHRHLPVLDGERLLGLVSIGDITRWISQANEQEASTLRSYITGSYT